MFQIAGVTVFPHACVQAGRDADCFLDGVGHTTTMRFSCTSLAIDHAIRFCFLVVKQYHLLEDYFEIGGTGPSISVIHLFSPGTKCIA